jgi:hypothetical protein
VSGSRSWKTTAPGILVEPSWKDCKISLSDENVEKVE